MYMASIWELYVYGQYMGAICVWPVYGSYMCMASIWELYGFNGQFLQPTYTGLTRDIYWTFSGHQKSLSYIPYKPHIGETVVPGIYLFCDKMHVHNR